MNVKSLLFTFVASLLISAQAFSADVTVTLTGIKQLKGKLYLVVYDSQATLQRHKDSVEKRIIQVNETSHKLIFSDLEQGEYGILVFQDLDGDQMLNKNLFGVPSEPYGFSNNPQLMGPPKFSEIKFTVNDSNIQITINLD